MDPLQISLEDINDETKIAPKRRKHKCSRAGVTKERDEEDIVPGIPAVPSDMTLA